MIDTHGSHNHARHSSGIAGLDAMLEGGFQGGRAMLVTGGPGSGKTMLGAQFLSAGAVDAHEPGLLLSFEESPERLATNFATVTFPFSALVSSTIHLVDGRPPPDVVAIGDFDLQGLIAALRMLVREHGITRIVIDAIDALFTLSRDSARIRIETLRLLDWLSASGVTALLTMKAHHGRSPFPDEFEFAEFMVDGVLELRSALHGKLVQRTARIVKRRGASFVGGEHPYTIGRSGLRVMCSPLHTAFPSEGPLERCSSGVGQLDAMLAGGYLRGTTTLVSGLPGASKTTFGAAFLAGGCEAGERCLFVGFDEPAQQMIGNVRSVGIALEPYRHSGLLRLESYAAGSAIADDFLVMIEDLVKEHRPARVVVDPISALYKSGGVEISEGAIEQLVVLFKSRGITALFTTLSDPNATLLESTATRVSTVADTWIHLSFAARGGERNRTLTIVKSRGTPHSPQTREVLLDASGIALVEVYNAGGEMLFGTARLEREQQQRAARVEQELATARELRSLDEQAAALAAEAEQIALQLAQLAQRRHDVEHDALAGARSVDADAEAIRLRRGGTP